MLETLPGQCGLDPDLAKTRSPLLKGDRLDCGTLLDVREGLAGDLTVLGSRGADVMPPISISKKLGGCELNSSAIALRKPLTSGGSGPIFGK